MTGSRARPGALAIGALIVVAGLLAAATVEDRYSLRARVGLPLSPGELVDRAQTILLDMGLSVPRPEGYEPSPGALVEEDPMGGRSFRGFEQPDEITWAWGFRYDREALAFATEDSYRDDANYGVGSGDPRLIEFWYRFSEDSLEPMTSLRATFDDPPDRHSGSAAFVLDPRGRLRLLEWTPPQYLGTRARMAHGFINRAERQTRRVGPEGPCPGWQYFFERAGLDPQAFTDAESVWNPKIDCEQERAWNGPQPSSTAESVRVEACESTGRVAYFEVIPVWRVPRRDYLDRLSPGSVGQRAGWVLLSLTLVAIGFALARRNLRRGRVRLTPACWVAAAVTVGSFSGALLHLPPGGELEAFARLAERAAGTALLHGAVVALVLLSLEPVARRNWPRGAKSWARLAHGQFRHARVGISVVVGAAAGVAVLLGTHLLTLYETDWPLLTALPTGRVSHPFGTVLSSLYPALITAFSIYLFLLPIRAMIARAWIAALASTAVLTAILFYAPEPQFSDLDVWTCLLTAAGAVVATYAGGFLGLAVQTYVFMVAHDLPLSLQVGAWYGAEALMPVIFIAALALYGCWIAIGRRSRERPDGSLEGPANQRT